MRSYKSLAALLILLSVGTPSFSEVICIEETELQAIVDKQVSEAVDKAVSVVVKEKDLKYLELNTEYKKTQVDLDVAKATADLYKKEVKKVAFKGFVHTVTAIIFSIPLAVAGTLIFTN